MNNQLPLKRLLVIGALLLLLFIVLGFPAAAVWRQISARASGLELVGINGTLWRGRADQIHWQLAPLGELYWQWRPEWPLTWVVQIQGPLLNLTTDVHPDTGRLRLSNIGARWPALLMRSPVPDAQLDGVFSAQLEELEWLAREPRRVSGQILWSDAKITAPVVVGLGQLRIDLSTVQDGLIQLRIQTTTGGEVQVSGAGEISAGQYQLSLHLRARNVHSNINQWLNLLGEPTSDGSIRVELQGPLHNSEYNGN